MEETDLSAIGTDVVAAGPPSDLARKEEQAFALEKAKEDHDHALKLRQHELGAIGRVFGSKDNAITYLIGFLVILSLIAVSGFSFSGATGAPAAIEFFKAIGFAGMGYLTGKSLEAKKD